MKTYPLIITACLAFGTVKAQLTVAEADVSDRILKVEKFSGLGKYRNCITIEQKYLAQCGDQLKLTNTCAKAVDVWWATEMEDGNWTIGIESIKIKKTAVSAGCIQTGRYVVLTKEKDDYISKVPTNKELKTILAKH